VNAGTLPELNAAELASQVAQDSSNYITLVGTVQLNVLTLKAYMALDAAAPFEVDTPPVDNIPIEKIDNLQPEAVYATALINQPLQKADALQIESARKYVSATKGARWPTVALGGNLGTNYVSNATDPILSSRQIVTDTLKALRVSGTSDWIVQDGVSKFLTRKTPYFRQLDNYFNQYVGLNISIPILNNGTLRTNYSRSKLNLRNAELQREQDNLNLKNNIYQAYTAAVTALHKYEANKITADATAKSADYAQKRYGVGMLNTVDLLINQNNYFNAKINLLYAQYDYVFKMKVLEFYKGLGIKLSK
jgi:outer membrane protein